MASAWIFLQYAQCFASGFLTSYLLCSRLLKNRFENQQNILSDVEQTEIVVITEDITAEKTDLRRDYTHGEIADGKQKEQEKHAEPRRSEE